MQHQCEGVTLRFRARLHRERADSQSRSLRPYSWVKEKGSRLVLVAKQEVLSDPSTAPHHDREFTIEVHTSDDTIAIFEAKTGDGFGGCWFARGLVPSSSQRGAHVKPSEIFSGCLLPVAGQMFQVLEADAFTMKHVRANASVFPERAIPRVLQSIVNAQLLEPLAHAFCQRDLSACGYISTSDFLHILDTTAATATALQDRIALAQEYVIETAGNNTELHISYAAFVSALQAVARGEFSQPSPRSRSQISDVAPPAKSSFAPADLQTQLRSRLLSRGLHSGRRFLAALVEASRPWHGVLDATAVSSALVAVGIRDLPSSTLNNLISSFSPERPSVHDVLSSVQCCFVSGPRAATCSRIFAALDKQGAGAIVSNDLVGRFDSVAACQLLRGDSSSTELRAQWIAAFEGHASAAGAITKQAFLAAMSEVSWMFVSDSDFAAFTARCLGAKSSLQPNR
jgi:hypothetical protein